MEGGNKETKKVWRGSLLMNFGDEVGETLTELENEYDDMIGEFESQKSSLRHFVPQEATIAEEEARSSSPALSDVSSKSGKKSSGGLKKSLKNTIKRKLSHRSRSGSQSSPHSIRKERGPDDAGHDRSETSSVSSEVFHVTKDELTVMSSVAENTNNSATSFAPPVVTEQHKSSSSSSPASSPSRSLHVGLPTKPPLSPGRQKTRQHNEHVIAPPVIVDGEVKRDYQYVSPVRHGGKHNDQDEKGGGFFRSGSFAKILGRSENGSAGKGTRKSRNSKEESPLKALYKSTVLDQKNNKENSNNNHNNHYLVVPVI